VTFVFGPFRLEEEERRLLKHGDPVHVPPKAFDVLRVLLANANGMVTKAQLLEQVWPDTFVEEGVLAVQHGRRAHHAAGHAAGTAGAADRRPAP
jgi:DNA-binding winged helix-turn-helix (wHTH) protein